VIPVWVAPRVRAHVAAYLVVGPLDELADYRCPVCESTLGEGRVALVYVGRWPGHVRQSSDYHFGPWAASAIPVHAACTDAQEEDEDVPRV